MPETSASIVLPKRNTNLFVNYVNGTNGLVLFFVGLLLYLLVVGMATVVMYRLAANGVNVLKQDKAFVTDFWDIIYFNFISILTIGYGDMSPVGFGRFIAVIETIFGACFIGLLIGIVIIKLTNTSDNSIVFSKYCYYAKDKERFFIVFINSNKRPLVNAEMSYVLKLGNWVVRPSIASPYIGKSAWTFFVGELSRYSVADLTIRKTDGFKFGIAGSYGFAKYSAYIKYLPHEIIVLDSRDIMTKFPELENPTIGSRALEECFHYRPQDAQNFIEYAHTLRDQGIHLD